VYQRTYTLKFSANMIIIMVCFQWET